MPTNHRLRPVRRERELGEVGVCFGRSEHHRALEGFHGTRRASSSDKTHGGVSLRLVCDCPSQTSVREGTRRLFTFGLTSVGSASGCSSE